MELSLVVLAAGLGRRFGGLKQLTGVGPNGETLLDYAIYDAAEVGFNRIVLVIREELENDFRLRLESTVGDRLKVDFAFQSKGRHPGPEVPVSRTKPWGTGHAVWSAIDHVSGPFAVINADDYYGRDALGRLATFLTQDDRESRSYALVGYRLGQTLSPHGPVSRGICEVSPSGRLTGLTD